MFFPIAAAALVAGGSAIAQPGNARPLVAEQSPFLGEWQLDLTRMPDTYGPPPKRVIFTFKDVGAGQWRTEVDITAPDDSVRHMAAQYRRDGKAVPGEGDTSEADSVAVNAPAPNVLVMSLSKNKALGSVRIYAISADGKEMTESATNVDNTGAPFVRNFHFKRVR
ncbi:hypothetical protein PIB19_09325 [Sphingomonas sp. 7/4-4]|uniref:hypothetical protein n=1 Tax=Sphingomonas sp. 7/4-4 TaxID=3018446 RepID=UPI0022F4064A|nr:hypothetical protein [Sphingomonas sp. 7/4-4]WBY09479.1 hypothetical protein PIB19_09325 [Sphingomonas sp. 7/4-4]